MKILKTVDGTMDRIFEKLPFEEFNKLQVYFDKTEPVSYFEDCLTCK